MITLKDVEDRQVSQPRKKQTFIDVARSLGDTKDSWQLGDYGKLKNKWYGQACYVVGTGPTLKDFLDKFGWSYFDGKHAIGINHAIEYYDKFEWFLALDRRFFDRTSYDMSKYQGLKIVRKTTMLKPNEKTVVFSTRNDMPCEDIESGVYCDFLSGLAALNIAIYAGANPIYLIGHGMGESSPNAYHFDDNYTAEVKDEKIWKKFSRVRNYFDMFAPWKHKIFSVSNYDEYDAIDNIKVDDFKESSSIKIEGRLPQITHLSFSPDIARHAETTRQMVARGYGVNRLVDFKSASKFPADLYVSNHFLSTDKDIKAWGQKNKTIDIVHTRGCTPAGEFKKVLAMSGVWRDNLIAEGVAKDKIEVVPACLKISEYQGQPDYGSKTFGRITRWSAGKIPDWWNRMLSDIFKKHKKSKCLMYIQAIDNKREKLKHNQMEYDTSVMIFENKFQYLKKMAFYVHANGYFREISPHGILEAMASGLPIVYLHEDSVAEMVGDAGISCHDRLSLQEAIEDLLQRPAEKIAELGAIAKKQAAKYDFEIMLQKYNAVVRRCLDE